MTGIHIWAHIQVNKGQVTTRSPTCTTRSALYREEYRGKQRDPRLWAGGKYGDIISLEQIETLDHIHSRLDASVLEAYGWPYNLSDEGILERLLALNLERSEEVSSI